MEKIKAGKPLIEIIKLCYRADVPLLLSGLHGIGKSELFRQAAEEMGIGFISRDLALMEPPDLIGLPKMNGKTTIYLPPDFLPTSGKGLIVFEELNRCERFMRAPCLQLLTDRSLNDYRLPPDWLPAAAINPQDDGYEVFDLDAAILSRFVQVTVVPDQREWIEWARQNGVHPAVVRYVEHDSSNFDHPQSNPRAWTNSSKILSAAEASDTSPRILRVAIAGLVGQERGAAFLSTMNSTARLLSATDVLKAYDRHRPQVQGWISDGKLDLVEAVVLALMKYLQPAADYKSVKANRKQWSNLTKFLYDLPGDLRERLEKFFKQRKYAAPRRPRKTTA